MNNFNAANILNGAFSLNGANTLNNANVLNFPNMLNCANILNDTNMLHNVILLNAAILNGINILNANIASGAISAKGVNEVMQNQSFVTFPYNQIFARFPLLPFLAAKDNNIIKEFDRIQSKVMMDYLRMLNGGRMMDDLPENLVVRCDENNTSNMPDDSFNNETFRNIISIQSGLMNIVEDVEMEEAPLDLSKPSTSNSLKRPRATGTSRRKGKAVKLDHQVVENSDDEELHEQQEQSSQLLTPNDFCVFGQTGYDWSKFTLNQKIICQHCNIVFGNLVMYLIHMGYHGENNPYTCNICGVQCLSRESFFLHVARSKHW